MSRANVNMIPLIVNTPDPMTKVRVLTAKDYSTKTLKTLHTAGVLHVEKSEELKPVDREALEKERREIGELLTNINDILSYMPEGEITSPREDVEVIYTKPLDEIDSEVRSLCTKLSNVHQRAAKLSEEVEKLQELSKYLGSMEQQADVKLQDLNFSGSYLFSRVFILSNEAYKPLCHEIKDYLLESIAITLENETIFYIIARVGDQKIVEFVIKSGGGEILQIPEKDLTVREFLEIADGNIRSLEEELAGLHSEIESKTRENLEKLVLFREALSAETERLAVLEKACEAKYVTLIEGWIPESNVEATISELKENIDLVFIDTRKPEQTEEPPTKMRNLAALKPFEVVVNMFGTPKYREWDPTPLTAYSFAVFFGLMLCDVAYAIGIILAARFLIRKFVDDPYSESYRLFQRVLYISGAVALILGLLTGNYLGDVYYLLFGVDSVLHLGPVREQLADPISFIILSIILGLIHINTAHVMALVGGVRKKDKGIVVNKIALFVLQIFGIPVILLWLFNISLPISPGVYTIFLYIVGASVVAIVVSSFMQRGGLGAVFWIFDLTGLLGDVMSYARLAGVGLASFYLASSFNMLAQLFSGMIPGVIGVIIGAVLAVVVLVFGHLINLALSGIGCFVHSLRLCFVEFLSKFYEGGGEAYSPFRLKMRPVL